MVTRHGTAVTAFGVADGLEKSIERAEAQTHRIHRLSR
jgi:hypothetical protein